MTKPELSLPDIVRKNTGTEVEQVEDETFRFTISDGTVDRHGDTVSVDGWKLENFLKNPVVLFAHDSRQPPVGKALRVWTESGKLKADVQFTPRDVYEFGDTVKRLVKWGALTSTSVGFRPIKHQYADDRGDPDSWFPPVDFLEQELLEFSIVPVPANPNANIDRGFEEVDPNLLIDWAEKILERHKGSGLWIPREKLFGFTRAVSPVKSEPPAAAPVKEDPEPTKEEIAEMVRSAVAKAITQRTGKL